jgi:anti-sigma regulatory factor (Ser/Thr protein kinase)
MRSTSTRNLPSERTQPQRVGDVRDSANRLQAERHAPARPAIPVLRHWADLKFPAHPRHVGEARHRLRTLLGGSSVTDDVLLCTSEVATNAVICSGSPNSGEYCTIHAELYEDGHVRIEVEDESRPWATLPKDRGNTWAAPFKADGQPYLGLLIVRQLSRSWGVQCHGDMARVVWFEIAPSAA